MFTGTLFFTSDMAVAQNAMACGCKVVLLMDNNPEINRLLPNAIIGSVLLPPYEAVAYNLAGNECKYKLEYQLYLDKEDPNMFLMTIFRSMMLGNHIVFYCPADEAEMFVPELMGLIEREFGISCGDEFHEFTYTPNIQHVAKLLTYMYLYEFIGPEEFLFKFPLQEQIDPSCIMKLCSEWFLPYACMTNQEIYAYFDNLRNQSQQSGRVLTNIVKRLN